MWNEPKGQTSSRRFRPMNYRRRAVSPITSGWQGVNVIEIRPGRWIRVQHIHGNHKDRDDSSSQAELSSAGTSCGNTQKHASEDTCSIRLDTKDVEQPLNPTSQVSYKSHRSDALSGKDDEVRTRNNSLIDKPKKIGKPQSRSVAYDKVDQQDGQPVWRNVSDSSVATCTRRNSKWSSQVSLISLMEEPGTVLFFLHGVGGCADVWYHQLQYFKEAGFEIVVPDMLGHGFSRAPRQTSAYKFEELAADMLTLFDRYAKKRNVLIGHSYGGSFCALIAKERSRKVTKLVLISNGGPIPLSPETCQLFCLPSCCLTCIKPLINGTFARQAFHSESNRTAAELKNAFDVPAYVLRAMMQGQYWPEGDETFHSSLAVAVLIIHGRQDELVALHETELMQETIYASQLELVESAGHMVMVEQPEKVNNLIHSFILKDMTIIQALQQSHMTNRVTSNPGAGTLLPSPVQRHKTVPNISIT